MIFLEETTYKLLKYRSIYYWLYMQICSRQESGKETWEGVGDRCFRHPPYTNKIEAWDIVIDP